MRTKQSTIYGLHCVACDSPKESITSALCPVCQRAVIRAYPVDFFDTDPAILLDQPLVEAPSSLVAQVDYAEAA